MNFTWAELRRRRVIRVLVAYAVVGWALVEVGDTLFDILELPGWMDRALLAAVALGLPLALVLAWFFDVTPDPGDDTAKGKAGGDDDDASAADKATEAAPRRFEFADLGRIDLDQLDLGRPQLTPLYGRAEECSIIEARLDAAVRGEGGLVLIGGSPGEGKTRLGEEALELGLRRGMLPLLGQAYEENTAPFIISTEIIEDIQRALPVEVLRNALGDTASEIARLEPGLRRAMPDIPPPNDLPAEQQQRYFFNALLEFTERLAGACPLVYLLDDMQWADESSAALLEHVAPHLHRLPVLMVATYRDVAADLREPFKRALSRLAHQDYVTRIRLKPLGASAVSEMIEGLYGRAAPEALAALIHRETGGNAFFAKSLFQHLAEEGELFDDNGDWRADLDQRDLPIPDGIRLVIERRLERLGEATVSVLSAGAVEGLRFDLRLLETALGEGEAGDGGAGKGDAGKAGGGADEVLAAIEAAERAGLLFAAGDQRVARYEFAHALVRQALIDALSPARRQRLHLSLGRALEALHGDAPAHAADIAGHYYRAGDLVDTAETCRFLVLSGERALETAAADEAVHAFSQALELEDDEIARAELLYQRGLAYRTAGDAIRSGDDWLAALPVFEAQPDPDRVAEICWAQAYWHAWANEMLEAERLARRGLAVVGAGPSVARCRLLAILGMTVGDRQSFELWERHTSEAIAMARALGDDGVLTEVLMGRQYLGEHWLEGAIHAEAAEEAVSIARRLGPFELCGTLGAALVGWMKVIRFDRIDDHWRECLELAEKYGDFGNVMHAKVVRGMSLVLRGQLDEGLELIDDRARWARRTGFAWRTIIIEMAAQVDFLRGNWERARSIYEEINAEPIEGTMAGCEPADRAVLLAYLGDPGAAAALDAIEPRAAVAGQHNQIGAWMTTIALIRGNALLGRRDKCAAHHDAAVQLHGQGTLLAWHRGLVMLYAGIAAAAGGAWSQAEAHFDYAQGEVEAHGLTQQAPELLFWRAQMLMWREEGDDRLKARELLARAAAAYRRLGMGGHVRLAEQRAVEAMDA